MKMKRFKRHKVKTEAAETSTSYTREQEVHDLAYYIHDRVELMHQVFSVIKYKELKAMAPACIRNISIDDLQELCTEELLGISSKRLCAILDGADAPSDTESSSPSPPPEQMETISLDSISSDEEILSQTSSKKKKHKHRRHSKSKSKRKKSNDQDEGEADRSKATRAGLTVLELLELQARARAIRAQLQQEQQNKPVSEEASQERHSSDNEVEIKEEPAEVVEISSDDEKPKIEELQHSLTQEKDKETPQQPTTVTKRISDLVITVPQKSKQKIKLNRNKAPPAPPPQENMNSVAITKSTNDNIPSVATAKTITQPDKAPENKKDKPRKKKKHKKTVSKDDIDNDEITLQLSDTEKMDLLEDLDRKHYDSVSSCSDSSSDTSSESDVSKKDRTEGSLKEETTKENNQDCEENIEKAISETEVMTRNTEIKDSDATENNKDDGEKMTPKPEEDSNKKLSLHSYDNENINDIDEKMDTGNTISSRTDNDVEIEIEGKNSGNTQNKPEIIENNADSETVIEVVKEKQTSSHEKDSDTTVKDTPIVPAEDQKDIEAENESQVKDSEKNLSEGEISDRESSEVEAVDLKPEVVCISDEEGGSKSKKKKKKKDKKSKKEKKSKKKSDFRESADQNFYKDKAEVIKDSSQKQLGNPSSIEIIDNSILADSSLNEPYVTKNTEKLPPTEIIDKVDLTETKTIDKKSLKEEQTTDKGVKCVTSSESPANAVSDDDIEAVYEILELSDDSSCCEVECIILSKEPTTLEIEALSAKIDEIDRVEVITDREIREYEKMGEETIEDIQNISWKDRYLDSTKVKKVLNTANILNALRKKNRDLKKKLAECKKDDTEEQIPETEQEEEQPNNLEEGSIEHYNTLEALTKYVDPVKEVSKDLKKDAKLLLKMYKKLLKYNDMNKPEDPIKKKKKKRKKVKKDSTNKKENSVVEEVDEEDNGKVKDCAIEHKEDRVTNKEYDLGNKEENVDFNDDLENREGNLNSKKDNIVTTEDG